MIISCSRRTDIPAFYSDWFFNRLQAGFVEVRNPRNPGQIKTVSLLPDFMDGFVFWTKNPAPMLPKLDLLNDYPFYFHFSLTPYGSDIEPHLPPKSECLDTFRRLSDAISPRRAIWRYDPVVFSRNIGLAYHEDAFGNLARQLAGFTKRCVISFVDLYRHIAKRMAAISLRAPDEDETRQLGNLISEIAASFGITVETCAEQIDLSADGIKHARCIDDRLMSEISGKPLFLPKDRYQRKVCGCVASVDIGAYNTCGHQCAYCYANISQKQIEQNRSRHHDRSPLLIGEIGGR
ncbi:MAG: DUF1848 domain-containing protein [Smithellaceae bacterium]